MRVSTVLFQVTVSLGCALLGSSGCGESKSEEALGSNSNWLLHCSDDKQCSDRTSCECGACTTGCDSDADCTHLENAHCATDEASALPAICGLEPPTPNLGLCVPRCNAGDCRDGQFCFRSGCVLAPLPENDFCSAVASWDEVERTREEELLQAYSELRLAGGVSCGADEPSAALPPLRFDPRLLCAARVLAIDLSTSRAETLVDSAGRTSPERMMLAGYASVSWGESLAFRASPSEALNVMLMEDGACAQLVGAQHRDVGVGSFGGVMVITLGSERP